MTPRPPITRTAAARANAAGALAASLALLGLLLSGPSAAQAPDAPQRLLSGIEEMVAIPGGGWRAVRVAGSAALYFVSGNGRWVVRGEAYDLWQGARLPDFEAVRASTSRIALGGLGAIWDDLAPISFGAGEDEIILFADPRCTACEALIARLRAFEDRYRIVVLQIPMLGEASGRIVRQIHCAADRDAALAALRDGAATGTLAARPDCDGGPILRRVATAQLIGLQAVPFMIHAASGRFVEGAPADLAAWLEGR